METDLEEHEKSFIYSRHLSDNADFIPLHLVPLSRNPRGPDAAFWKCVSGGIARAFMGYNCSVNRWLTKNSPRDRHPICLSRRPAGSSHGRAFLQTDEKVQKQEGKVFMRICRAHRHSPDRRDSFSPLALTLPSSPLLSLTIHQEHVFRGRVPTSVIHLLVGVGR